MELAGIIVLVCEKNLFLARFILIACLGLKNDNAYALAI